MYLVICNDKSGEVIMQRKLSDAESWDETIRDLARVLPKMSMLLPGTRE